MISKIQLENSKKISVQITTNYELISVNYNWIPE